MTLVSVCTYAETTLVPSGLLRAWDPVTVFFDEPHGPTANTPEADARRLFDEWPAHPGAFEWVDSRTVQFRPATPWPASSALKFSIGEAHWTLHAVSEPPSAVTPPNGAADLVRLDTITLDFPHPVELEFLASHLRVGRLDLSQSGARPEGAAIVWLPADALRLKRAERHRPADPTRVFVELREPVPSGTKVVMELRLTSGPGAPVWRYAASTSEDFRIVGAGCSLERYPLPPNGAHYAANATLKCAGDARQVAIEFSAAPVLSTVAGGAPDGLELARLVNISPRVDDLEVTVADRLALVRGSFQPGVVYRLDVGHAALNDVHGRMLTAGGRSSVHVQFPHMESFVRWRAGSGVLERFGAKHLPVAGRGVGQIDVRIHKIDPLDTRLWPFTQGAVTTDESVAPSGPGEALDARDHQGYPTVPALAARLRGLGTPEYSDTIVLPLGPSKPGARFGVDIAPAIATFSAQSEPGTYVVGLRRFASESSRQWMRVQVTDLALSTVRRDGALRFVVTSLSSGQPVAAARIRVQGWRNGGAGRWRDFIDEVADERGTVDWTVNSKTGGQIARIVVQSGDDTLVIDPNRPPDVYAGGRWQSDEEPWLQWTRLSRSQLRQRPERACHVFTERPVYKPDALVHVKGWLREREAGLFAIPRGKAMLVIHGPGGASWRFPIELDHAGGFYHAFDEADMAAGAYSAHVEYPNWSDCGHVGFRKEDYKLPEFELRLHGPDVVSLDGVFDVTATSHYYAGGRVADRPIQWRVTQFPHQWQPGEREGFVFQSAQAFAAGRGLSGEAVLELSGTTDTSGAGRVEIDPANEQSALPRRYVVEASVTGNDGRVVTATREVLALPAFALGVRVPRVVRGNKSVSAELLSLAPNGAPEADREVNVRLLQREWHAQLRVGNFASGVARYITEPVDRELWSDTVRTTADKPVQLNLPVAEAGVYILRLSARDALGRVQVVERDFFVAGDDPVTWSRPPARTFQVTSDRDSYAPGERATLVLESPYQNATALMVIEAPAANQHRWIPIVNGAASVDIDIAAGDAPHLPVHFLILRGRAGDGAPPGGVDPGRPATVASTHLIRVEPRAHQLSLKVEHPATARPGEVVQFKVQLADPAGAPLQGQVALWLVDQAVLALGREARLDPLPSFIKARAPRVRMHDTRNSLFGYLPFSEYPGGGAGDSEPLDLTDNVTVRSRFVAVPFYAGDIEVDASGEAVMEVELPDNLTNFRLRAKAISGAGRFGHTTGNLSIRLPIVAQARLPRFVRPGDSFLAGASIRAVDGIAGESKAQLNVYGLDASTAQSKDLLLTSNTVGKVDWPVTIPANAAGALELTVAVQRTHDGVGDGFAAVLPIRPDRRARVERKRVSLAPRATVKIDGTVELVRPGTLLRSVRLSTEPAIAAMAGAISTLNSYPYACTEQRIAKVHAGLAVERFGSALGATGATKPLSQALAQTLAYIESARDDRGLVGYWPGSRGYVSLTAWSFQLVISARRAGHAVPADLEAQLAQTLQRSLRSDFPGLVQGSEFAERVWALAALNDAGLADPGYASELATNVQFFPVENVAQVARILAGQGPEARTSADALAQFAWRSVGTELRNGEERFSSIQEQTSMSGVLLPGEIRAMGELLRTAVALGNDKYRGLLSQALVERADATGWGDTNANASALRALADTFEVGNHAGASVVVRHGSASVVMSMAPTQALKALSVEGGGALELVHTSGKGPDIVVLDDASYMPMQLGAQAKPSVRGFVVRREWTVIDSNAPKARIPLAEAGTALVVDVGTVVEERIELVNPQDRHHVVVMAPLAAGLEPLNPELAATSAQAKPGRTDSHKATYRALRDDHVAWFFDTLPAGTVSLNFRTRAVTRGKFVQPPAFVELMYDRAVSGSSAGGWVEVGTASVQ
jgi:alpha-2-macroglobulin